MDRIAIVGVGGIFPGARDLDEFWQKIAGGIDSGRSVPEGRWFLPANRAFSPGGPQPDRVYSTWGCFLEDWQPDLRGLKIDQNELEQLDPLCVTGLHAAAMAWRDAGQPQVDPERAGVILGHIVLPTESTSALARDVLVQAFAEQLLGDQAPEWKTSNWSTRNWEAAGLPASLIATSLGLQGPSLTLDAACASSLYALKLACDELLSGRADVMLAGGLSRPDCQYTQMGFAQLQALSKGSRCAPLSGEADGLVVGEGAGLFVLKRLEDALRNADHIYATIAGIGLSNDRGANLLAPHSEGQLRAMRLAYEQAGWQPGDVDLIECHATGTPVGDAVELESLHQLWADEARPDRRTVLGSVKSNVGHLLTAAGGASLIKLLWAFHAQTLPPTANYRVPAPALQQPATPFRVLSEAEPWERRSPTMPRRAAINAFGFGGINAHVLLEEWDPATLSRQSNATPLEVAISHEPIAIVGLAAHVGSYQTVTELTDALLHSHTAAAQDWSIPEIVMPVAAFRIPPVELEDMLPQQQLMLQMAAAALDDAGLSRELGVRTGVFVGIGLDPHTTNFHCRWSLAEFAEEWATRLSRRNGTSLPAKDLEAWIGELREAFGPPLTANRVMGNLGGIVASRLGREFDVGGPCFTISSEEESGLRALDVAIRALQQGELDRALVGAVDFPTDVRRQVAGQAAGDGALALVLKRKADAERDGDRIYALVTPRREERVLSDDGTTEGQVFCASDFGAPAALDHLGAASSLLPVLLGAVSINRRVIFSERQYWLQDATIPRRLHVDRSSSYGRLSFLLEEPPVTSDSARQKLTASDGGTGLFLLSAASDAELRRQAGKLREQATKFRRVDQAARAWFWLQPQAPSLTYQASIVAKSLDELRSAVDWLEHRRGPQPATVYHESQPLGPAGGLAFVFPGSGNQFLGMGKELLAAFPQVLRQQEAENTRLASQYRPDVIWNGPSTMAIGRDHKSMIFGQVALGTALCDWLTLFGIRPQAAIGYSLGESAALFGLRAWRDRDEMLQRMEHSPLFGSDLVAPFDAARQAWQIPEGEDVPWLSGVVDRSAADLRSAIERRERVYLLIINTPQQCVIGGDRTQVESLVQELGATLIPFPAPSTVHCSILKEVSQAYTTLHLMETNPPSGVDFYSGASGQKYGLSRESAAGAILAQAINTVDFPRVVQSAYRDGIRLFLEIGPGSSCTRMIGEILANRSHWSGALCPATADPVAHALKIVAQLAAHAVPVDLSPLYGNRSGDALQAEAQTTQRCVVTPTQLKPWIMTASPERVPAATGNRVSPPIPEREQRRAPVSSRPLPQPMLPPGHSSFSRQAGRVTGPSSSVTENPSPLSASLVQSAPPQPVSAKETHSVSAFSSSPTISSEDTILRAWDRWMTENAAAHAAFLHYSDEARRVALDLMGRTILPDGPSELPAAVTSAAPPLPPVVPPVPQPAPQPAALAAGVKKSPPRGTIPTSLAPRKPLAPPDSNNGEPPRSLTYEQCLEYAIGKIGNVLGPKFAAIDHFPTRVRLPDVPLMLVDRMVTIEGEPLSMTSGRVVTEKDIRADDWYLDCGRIPTCLAVESGQADLFLSGWLGIDLQTKGLASYRLLDAVVTFHAPLPGPGRTIRYDIRINHFFQQGETYLFRFEFDATVDGQPLLTMRDGCAGFFTQQELAAGQGVIQTTLDRQPRPGLRPQDWEDPVPMQVDSYDDAPLSALREGDLAGCFGSAFAGLPLRNPVTLPSGRLNLVHRVLSLDPAAGKYGLGQIRAEADIHPDDWFLTCHFCDDQVMPGTLMYECCLHTLRVYLLRMGWIGEQGQIAYEPVPGVRSRLKCRGQVLASTQKVWYEVTLKEIGYGRRSTDDASGTGSDDETPYCLADALMYADGKPIVEITDMSVRLSGLTRSAIAALWSRNHVTAQQAAVLSPAPSTRPAPLFDTDRITAFAIGKPSEAFGDRYRVFDEERKIARLPGPPFQFLDRIVSIENCEPWVLAAGGTIVAEYDVPPDAWYFEASRSEAMPFAVLLETALQPCGWLAGYLGSALTSDTDLSFRNLGGKATHFRDVTRDSGTLTTTVKITRVSQSAGMIIQHFDYDLRCNGEPVYVGNTYFGFFSKDALANQVGIRDAKVYQPTPEELGRALSFPVPLTPPFADETWCMVRRVDALVLDGGPQGLGYVRGSVDVDPDRWFFKAHFYQDPVWPGSLGLESFIQLLQIYVAERWGLSNDARTVFSLPREEDRVPHEWIYRGQVIPRDRIVTVDVVITAVDDATRTVTAAGFLTVDGRVIYEMKEFRLRARTTV